MRQILGNSVIQVTEFAVIRNGFEYNFRRKATGQWTITRRATDKANIPPHIEMLHDDGFAPVLAREGRQPASFGSEVTAVRYIEINY